MKYPIKKVFITQEFGANPDMYAQWGYKGHNGIDFRAFNPDGNKCYTGGKSEIFSPHSGKIIENTMDTNGYGWYIKIENAIEGSVLGHFSSQCSRPVGENINEGDFLAFQGTTGNSSGIHLHWGYYRHPRDRQNGYGGMIDQTPYLNPVEQDSIYREYDLTNKESMKICVDDHIKVAEGQLIKKTTYETLKGQYTELQKQNDDLSKKLGDATADLATTSAALLQTQESFQKELNSQHDWADRATKAEEETTAYRAFTELCLSSLEEDLKITTASETKEERLKKIIETAMNSMEVDQKYQSQIKVLEEENKRLLKNSVPIEQLGFSDIWLKLRRLIWRKK